MGELDEHAGPVAGCRVGSGGAAVLEIVESLEREIDDLVAGVAVQARDAGNTAGVVLEASVVKTGGAGRRHRPRRRGFRAAHANKSTGPGTDIGDELEQIRGVRWAQTDPLYVVCWP